MSAGVIRAGLALKAGSLRLIGLRIALLVLCFVPSLLAAVLGIAASHGHRPDLAGHPGPLPFPELVGMLRELPSAFSALAAGGMVAVLLLDQLLTAGGLALLDPHRDRQQRPRVWATVWQEGTAHFWRFSRIVLLAMLLFALGATLIGWAFTAWSEHGAREGYTGQSLVLVVPGLRLLATTLWLAVVGAFAFWCRLLTVADERARVRRTAVHSLRLILRRPLRSLGFFVSLTLAVQLLGGLLLVQLAPPQRGGDAVVRILAWLVYLTVHAFAWHWLLHAGQRLYALPDLDEIRNGSDEPWGWWRRWRGRGSSRTRADTTKA